MEIQHVLCLSLCFLALFSVRCHGGWLNNVKSGSVLRRKTDSSSIGLDPTRVAQLSWTPRAFLYKGFLSEYECDYLIKLGKDKLEKSMVADNESGKSIPSEVRTSSGMFLQKAQGYRPYLSPRMLWFAKVDSMSFYRIHPSLHFKMLVDVPEESFY